MQSDAGQFQRTEHPVELLARSTTDNGDRTVQSRLELSQDRNYPL
jgi:hypothetical protein